MLDKEFNGCYTLRNMAIDVQRPTNLLKELAEKFSEPVARRNPVPSAKASTHEAYLATLQRPSRSRDQLRLARHNADQQHTHVLGFLLRNK